MSEANIETQNEVVSSGAKKTKLDFITLLNQLEQFKPPRKEESLKGLEMLFASYQQVKKERSSKKRRYKKALMNARILLKEDARQIKRLEQEKKNDALVAQTKAKKAIIKDVLTMEKNRHYSSYQDIYKRKKRILKNLTENDKLYIEGLVKELMEYRMGIKNETDALKRLKMEGKERKIRVCGYLVALLGSENSLVKKIKKAAWF